MKEDANELARRGHYLESISIAVAAMGAEWTRKRASPAGNMTVSDAIEFLQMLLKRIEALRASQPPGTWTLILRKRVIEELVASIAIVEAQNQDWVDGSTDTRAVVESEVERYRTSAVDVGKILKVLESADAKIEDALPVIKESKHLDTVEELLSACGPGQPTLIGPAGPLIDLNVKKISRFLASRHSYPIAFEVEDCNERAKAATVRIHADTPKDSHGLLHGTTEPLQMDISACPLGWEHCLLAEAAKVPLRGTSSMKCAVLRADKTKATLRLTSVQFAQQLTFKELKTRIDQRLLAKIEPVLKRMGEVMGSE